MICFRPDLETNSCLPLLIEFFSKAFFKLFFVILFLPSFQAMQTTALEIPDYLNIRSRSIFSMCRTNDQVTALTSLHASLFGTSRPLKLKQFLELYCFFQKPAKCSESSLFRYVPGNHYCPR